MRNVCHRNSACCINYSAFPPAFTLIELVIAMVIASIIALVTLDYLVNAGRVYTLLQAQRQVDSDAIGVVQRMRRETRAWRANITNTSTEWAFFTPKGTTNLFKLSGDTVLLNDNTLAKSVQTFRLYYSNVTNTTVTDPALIRCVVLALRVTNNLAASELRVNFFLREGLSK